MAEIIGALDGVSGREALDPKLHDIPSTMAGAVNGAAGLEIDLLTVHAAGGPCMLTAARDASAGQVRLVVVTHLTSLSPHEVDVVWGRDIRSIRDQVARLGELARDTGMDGVLVSPPGTPRLRRSLGNDFLVATPGIRHVGKDQEDQKWVATPAEAVAAGADYLVIGRPVTRAADPGATLTELAAEVARATCKRPFVNSPTGRGPWH